MSRIQQILAKAERDGTARRLGVRDEVAVEESASRSEAAVWGESALQEAPPSSMHPAPEVEARGFSSATDERAAGVRSIPPVRDGDRTHVERAPETAVGDVPVEAAVALDVVLAPVLVAALDPQSGAAEQYRSLRSRISQSENGHAIRVIQITSPGAHDGKTVTSLNLALTMGQEFQRRVLVIDADLRGPRVHSLLGLPAGPGLVDVLTDTATLEEALVEIPEYHLTVLRAGRAHERPAELLASGAMRRLIDTFRTQFDRIVVDSPPATVSDPVSIAPLADRLVLVVRSGATTKPAIAHAIGVLGSAKLLGLVFNDSGAQQAPYRARA